MLLLVVDELELPPPPFFFFLLFDVAGGGAGLVFRPEFHFHLISKLVVSTWYCNYWRRDDKGINLEVGDVWHVSPV